MLDKSPKPKKILWFILDIFVFFVSLGIAGIFSYKTLGDKGDDFTIALGILIFVIFNNLIRLVAGENHYTIFRINKKSDAFLSGGIERLFFYQRHKNPKIFWVIIVLASISLLYTILIVIISNFALLPQRSLDFYAGINFHWLSYLFHNLIPNAYVFEKYRILQTSLVSHLYVVNYFFATLCSIIGLGLISRKNNYFSGIKFDKRNFKVEKYHFYVSSILLVLWACVLFLIKTGEIYMPIIASSIIILFFSLEVILFIGSVVRIFICIFYKLN